MMNRIIEEKSVRVIIDTVLLMVGICALAILACLFAYRFDNKYTAQGPQAEEGVLRLGYRELDMHPVLMLIDGWEFYNGVLLLPEDFAGDPPDNAEYIFIGQYGGFDAGHDGAPPHGSATYRIRIDIPDKLRTYALELPEIFSAYRLYINGSPAAGMGDPNPSAYFPAIGNMMISFEAESRIELIFAVSDFTHFYSGIVYPPAFGDPHAVYSLLNTRLLFRTAICSVVFVIGLLSLLIGLFSTKKAPGVIFTALCLCFLGYAGYPIIRMFFSGYYPWYAVENISYNAMLAVVMVLQRMVSKPKFRWERIFLWFGLFACLAAVAVHIAMPAGNMTLMLAYSDFISAYSWIVAAYLTFTSVAALLRGTFNSKPLLCGALIFDCALIMDRLLPMHEPMITGWFSELSGFMLILTVGLAIGKELATGYRDAAVLFEREEALHRLTAMQQSYYRVLEEKATQVEIINHDLRHHYVVIGRFIKDKQYAELETYLSESMKAIDESNPETYCANKIINTLANHFNHVAEQNRIDFDMRCAVGSEIGISDADLCGILGNLFENAIDACLRMETGQRFIRVGITEMGNLLTIRFWNSTSFDIRQSENGFLSTKRKGGAGYGLESIKAIAKRYNGETSFSWNKADRLFDSSVTLST